MSTRSRPWIKMDGLTDEKGLWDRRNEYDSGKKEGKNRRNRESESKRNDNTIYK